MSFGGADDVSLAEARKLHAEARAVLVAGRDPLEERDRTKLDLTLQFADVADAYIAAHEARWHGAKTAQQTTSGGQGGLALGNAGYRRSAGVAPHPVEHLDDPVGERHPVALCLFFGPDVQPGWREHDLNREGNVVRG
jgi:hypothetical protein